MTMLRLSPVARLLSCPGTSFTPAAGLLRVTKQSGPAGAALVVRFQNNPE